jgi:NAD(P)-dependent dehydrogenase (short-subunit alcohol dehydrogenase family)
MIDDPVLIDDWHPVLRSERGVHAGGHAGRVAVVTGAAGAIGRGVVERLVAEGATVVAADRAGVPSEPAETRTRGDRSGSRDGAGSIDGRVVDVSSESDVEGLFDDIVARHGRVDYLVQCAAIFPGRRFSELEPETWNATLAVNLTGSFLCSRAALRRMVPRHSGSVVLLSSMLARTGGPDCAHYAATKGGILGLTRAMALDVATHGVRVNSVSPGITDTPQPRGHMSEAEMYSHAGHIPLGRIGRVDDVVEAVVFLLGDESSFMTGQDLRVNGGYPAW